MDPLEGSDKPSSAATPSRTSRRLAANRKQQEEPMDVDPQVEEAEELPPAPATRKARKRKTDEDSVASSKASKGSRTSKRTRKTAESVNGDSKPPAVVVTETAASTVPVQDAEPAARAIPVVVDNLRIPAHQTPGKPSKETERRRPLEGGQQTNLASSSNEVPAAPGLMLNFGNEQGGSTNIAVTEHASGLDDLLARTSGNEGPLLVVQQQSEAIAFQARHTRTASRNIDLDTTFTSFQDVLVTETNVTETQGDQAGDMHQIEQPGQVPEKLLLRRMLRTRLFWLLVGGIISLYTVPKLGSHLITMSDILVRSGASLSAPPLPNDEDIQQIVTMMEQVLVERETADVAREELLTLTVVTERLKQNLEDGLATQQAKYQHSVDVARGAESILQTSVSEPETLLSKTALTALKDQLRSFDGVERFLLDVSFIESWVFPDATRKCNETIDSPLPINMKQFIGLAEILKKEAGASVDAVMSNEFAGTIQRWVRVDLADVLDAFSDGADIAKIAQSVEKQSLKSFTNLIGERLAIERADQTGMVDYACVLNGAKVIRTGEWATSPSLKDELPLLNRMVDVLGLRFYGFGPESAISPVVPFAALGQCWSFTQHSGPRSKYGTLSISLAKQVKVHSISIEHPPKEITDRVKTAIRHFRVVGFEDADAATKPWDLGTFEYSITGAIRQEFPVAQVVGDQTVPPLRSIALAVDSNWGGEYASLYRVRVFSD